MVDVAPFFSLILMSTLPLTRPFVAMLESRFPCLARCTFPAQSGPGSYNHGYRESTYSIRHFRVQCPMPNYVRRIRVARSARDGANMSRYEARTVDRPLDQGSRIAHSPFIATIVSGR
jgi:hypothetical protein